MGDPKPGHLCHRDRLCECDSLQLTFVVYAFDVRLDTGRSHDGAFGARGMIQLSNVSDRRRLNAWLAFHLGRFP